ncbi:MAG: serine hydrolase [Flavitalea sp.]
MDTTNSVYFNAMKIIALFCIVIFSACYSYGQSRDHKLENQIKELAKGYNGDIGIYVLNLSNGKTASYNADSIFPTASMVKLPILLGVMDKIQSGHLKDTQNLVYTDSLLYEGVDILGSFKNGEKIELGKVVMLMLTMSDNTASLWLQSLAGGGSRINQILDSLGFVSTRVNSRTPGREANRTNYGWGQTTPREMVLFMQKMYNRELVNSQISEKMLKLTSRNFWDDVGHSAIPPGIFVSSKNGAVNASRSEVMLVYGKSPYIFCISTKNNKDTSWESNNEAWVLTRKISTLVWKRYGQNKKLIK